MKPLVRVLGACLAFILAGAVAAVPAFSESQGRFDRTLTVSGRVDLTVETGAGTIDVRQGEAGKVAIHATIQPSSHHPDSDIEARIREIESNPPIEQDGDRIVVGHFNPHDRERGISIRYELVVPAETKVRTESGSGGQSVEGVSGPVDASSGSGNLRLKDIGSEAHVRAGSGEIELSSIHGCVHASAGSGSIKAAGIAGGLHASTGSGNVSLEQTAAGDVDISTGAGAIDIRVTTGAVRATTCSGSIHAQGRPASGWRLHTGSGSVTAEIPSDAAFNLSASSSSGDIETSREIAVQGSVHRGELHGTVNGGGPLVELATNSGTIEIR
jgi:DUF4097 and DUF4098 domain-containing protein YvlB